MKLIKAKIEVVLEVDDTSEGYMADVISAIFSENLQASGVIVDWQYSNNGTSRPVYLGNFEEYEEGDAFPYSS